MHHSPSPRCVTRRALVALVALGSFALAFGQVQVDFVPSAISLNPGETALVEVTLTGVPAPGLAAFQLTLDYDPQSIDIVNPNEAFRGTVDPFASLGGDPLCTTVRGTPTCDDPAWFLTGSGRTPVGTDSIDSINGRVQVAYGTAGSQALPTGNGTIAMIEVAAQYDGTVTVNLSDVVLADDSEPPATYTVALGSLVVTSGTGIANLAPILDPIGNRSVYETQPLTIPLTSNDPDANGLTLSTTGLPGFCGLTDNGDGSGSIDCNPLLGDVGIYPVTVTVLDDGGPNLSDNESFDIDVGLFTCVDGDGDGFGSPGDVSCPAGAALDCDDTAFAINPAAIEDCRSGFDDDCNGLEGALEAQCPSSICLFIALGAPASDPTVTLLDPGACPTSGTLARGVDVVWGDLSAVNEQGGEIRVGALSQIACADTGEAQLFDNLRPLPGQIDFFLVRESGQAAYGIDDGGLPRIPDSGDCP